ncbi:hypothetical protein [Paenibacillus sp. FSL W7-1287]|uniref:hypothetical protein n=1 Tax=Paenibacillus sp. FSL W7-1287 TaxID=2954538 RepID=UPI0030FA6755
MSIIINDILVPMLSYSCLNNEKLQEGARLRIEIETQISKNKNKENLKLVEVDFSIMIQELSDNKEEFFDDEDDENICGEFNSKYRVFIETSKEDDVEIREEVLRQLVPYIQKGVFDFSVQVGIPNMKLPYDLWKYENKSN